MTNKQNKRINKLFRDQKHFSACAMFSAYHLLEQNLLHLTLSGYILESIFRCQNLQKEGVCIFVLKNLYCIKINISYNCKKGFRKFFHRNRDYII
jgi:hypothetical protein